MAGTGTRTRIGAITGYINRDKNGESDAREGKHG